MYILGMLPTMYDYSNGSVLEQEIRDASGALKTVTENTYQEYTGGYAPAANGYTSLLLWTGSAFPVTNPYELFTLGDLKNNKLLRIKTATTTLYRDSGISTKQITYSYDNPSHYKLSRMITTDSKGKTITTRASYPQDMSGEPFMSELIAQNRLNPQIVSQTHKGTVEDPEQSLLRRQYTYYSDTTTPNGLVLPSEVHTLKGDPGNQEQRQVYEQYDSQGRLLQYRQTNGTPVSYIWGYHNSKPIAKLEGIAYSEINPLAISTLQNLSDNDQDSSSEQSLRNSLDGLRSSHPGAMVTTFTYDPLVGVTSLTDHKGYTTTYFYDAFNRLEAVKDAQGNITGGHAYNYASQAMPSEPLIAGVSYGSSENDHQWFSGEASGGSGDYSYGWFEGIGDSSTDFEANTSGTSNTYQLMTNCAVTKYVKLVVTDNITGEVAEAVKVNNNGCNYPALVVNVTYGTHSDTWQNFIANVSGGSGSYSYAWHKGVGTSSFTFETNVCGTLPNYQLQVSCSTYQWVELVVTDTLSGESVAKVIRSNNSPCSGGGPQPIESDPFDPEQ